MLEYLLHYFFNIFSNFAGSSNFEEFNLKKFEVVLGKKKIKLGLNRLMQENILGSLVP